LSTSLVVVVVVDAVASILSYVHLIHHELTDLSYFFFTFQSPAFMIAVFRYVERNQPVDMHDLTMYNIPKIQAASTVIPKLSSFNTTGNCNDPNSFKIAVVDSGYDGDHEDSPCIPGYTTSPTPNCKGALFFSNNGTMTWDNPSAAAWHGTLVGGIINAKLNAVGYTSVIPESTGICYIFPRVVNDAMTAATTFYLYQAVNWALSQGVKVINLSVGTSNTQVGVDTMAQANALGVIVVASMGNHGTNKVVYPAGYTTVVAVGSTNETNGVSKFSAFGPHIDCAAPGERIYSMLSQNRYGGASGTSMATAHVTGAAARIWSVCPQCSSTVVTNCLLTTAQDTNTTGYDVYSGFGVIQMEAAYLCMKASVGCCP
jgi:subtilisin family serine protease